jgi:DNA mismatch repair protein MutL
MFLIDQHAAHERIVYEQIDQCLTLDDAGNVIWNGPTQRVMFPICVELPKIINICVDDSVKCLRAIGFECAINADDQAADSPSVAISAIPKICESLDVSALVCDIVGEISDRESKSSLLEVIHKMFATYACHHSVRANHPLNEAEMNALLRQIEGTPRSGQCNHGRPTYVKLLRKDIERLFERTG